jgi:hypothetical protein
MQPAVATLSSAAGDDMRHRLGCDQLRALIVRPHVFEAIERHFAGSEDDRRDRDVGGRSPAGPRVTGAASAACVFPDAGTVVRSSL